jgi:hypothetical protein
MIDPQKVVQVLLTEAQGLGAPSIRRRLRTTQPTLWRALDKLIRTGRVVREGRARATLYHAADPGLGIAALRSRRMHEVAAAELIRNPALLEKARERLHFLRQANPHGGIYQDRWAALLGGPMEPLLREMTEPSERADTLRRESPFTTLIHPRERQRIFESLKRAA